jgi:putative transposase
MLFFLLINFKMDKYKNKYRIKSTRLQYWDYASPGYYFITICTKNREDYFGEIKNEKMCLNEIGDIAQKFWLEIPNHFSNVTLDEFIIMPNHVHGIVIINDDPAAFVAFVETRHCLVSTNANVNADADAGTDIDTNTNTYIINNNNITTTPDITKTAEQININAAIGHNIGKTRFQNQGKNTISSIIGSYKSICTKTINKTQNQFRFAWQPRFYEHIIRDTKSLERIRHYIINNPINWHSDRNNL